MHCAEALKTDEVEPPCFGDGHIPGVDACWLPGYEIFDRISDREASRAVELRNKLLTLRDLIGPETVLKMYDADKEDLEMLAYMEETLKSLKEEGKNG